MKSSSRFFFWFQTLVVIGCFSALQAQTKPGSYSATNIKGSVTWVNPKTQVEAPLTKGQKLPQGALVKTGVDSSVVLVFANGATVTLKPETSLEVSKFAQQSFSPEALLDESIEPSISSTELNLVQGELIGEVRKLRTGSEFNVNTPVGAAGVRGTKYFVSYNPNNGKMIIQTAEGLVVYIARDGVETPIPADMKRDGDGNIVELTPEEKAAIVAVAEEAVLAAIEERQNSGEPGDATRQNPIETEINVADPDEVSGSGT